MNYAWNIETPPEAVTVAPATLRDGYYTLGKAGGYYAESASSIFIADQEFNQIVHVNAATDTVIDSFGVLAAPTDMAFVSSTRTIYTALADAGKLAKLKIDTGELTEITIASEALSISAYNGRVYYTLDEGVYTWRLFSIDDSDVPVSHGVIQGDMIELNPINGEIVAAWTGTSPASVYRYGIDSSGAVSELQFSRDLGSNARDIAFSPDGIQLVVASGSGNGSGYTFYDILASDLSVSSGSWDTSAYPRSADFSNTGNYFAASNTTDLFVFDSLAHTLTEQHDPNEAICGLNYYTLEDVLFSEDDKHVFAKLTCGFDKEKSVLFYYSVP